MSDAEDYGSGGPVMPEAADSPGPLFARPGDDPFWRSGIAPTPLERMIAAIIWQHKGRARPVPIAEIQGLIGHGLNDRKVKEVVEQLRVAHRVPIGARRDPPVGYFRIMDGADLRAALEPYKSQIFAMLRVARALTSEAEYAEFAGQIRLELDKGDRSASPID